MTDYLLSLVRPARVDRAGERLRIAGHGQVLELGPSQADAAALIARVVDGQASHEALGDAALAAADLRVTFCVLGALGALDRAGLLQRQLLAGTQPFALLVPAAAGFTFGDVPPGRDESLRLSPLAHIRAVDGALQLASATGRARLVLQHPDAVRAVSALAEPRSLAQLEEAFPHLADGTLGALVAMLRACDALQVDAGAADWWEFHDLLFHMCSRRGRHDAPYGGTFREHRHVAAPLVKPRMDGPTVRLNVPDLDRLRRTDASFTTVLENRRSVREYGVEPLTLAQLGEFLYRTARYQRVLHGESADFAMRTAPAGGALHELELYVVVAACEGLDGGVYHYRPLEHELTMLKARPALRERYLEEASWTGDRRAPLNVCLQATARCQRVFWKYESMAYALILKNLGAMVANMYLVATAMELAPCALGGGDAQLFAELAGLDPFEEPAVGEFLLGSRAAT